MRSCRSPLLVAASLSLAPSSEGMVSQGTDPYTLRRYRPSDLDGVKRLFSDNIREEWRDTYHGGRYAENAEGYIDSVVKPPDSDLNSVEGTYFGGTGGFFWVLTHDGGSRGDGEGDVVGTCGLQRVSPSVAEIRRMCVARGHRRKGWGGRMLQGAIRHAEGMGVGRIVVSTIEHSVEGIAFYKRHGFVDTIDEGTGSPKKSPVHGTPICEVFMEYIIAGG